MRPGSQDPQDVRASEERAREAAESARREADAAHRMATFGALVSSLAHEVNNPNHTIMLNVPVLRAAWQDAIAVLDQHARSAGSFRLANIAYADMRDDVLRLIDEIHAGADRIRAIVGRLRSHARGHWQHDARAVELEPVLAAAAAGARAVVDAATDAFALVVADPLPPVRGNRVLLTQLFMGLLAHAARSLTARTQRIELRAQSAAHAVVVEVVDQGRGVPEDEVANLTKPFHQADGGLELPMAAWIAQQHGGSIAIESAVGRGTTVRVTLPASQAAAALG